MTRLLSKIHNSESSNIRGEFGEALARAFFIEHGFRVSEAGGNWYPYDLLAERHAVTYRVQVKTSVSVDKDGYHRVSFGMSDEFDLALVITDSGFVYLIPRRELVMESPQSNRRKAVIYPRLSIYMLGQLHAFEPIDDAPTLTEIEAICTKSQIQNAAAQRAESLSSKPTI